MQKPDDIPQDIWETADALVERLSSNQPLEEHETTVIARAILAERERGEIECVNKIMHAEAKAILAERERAVSEHMARLNKDDQAAMEEFDRKVRKMAPASDGWGTVVVRNPPPTVVEPD